MSSGEWSIWVGGRDVSTFRTTLLGRHIEPEEMYRLVGNPFDDEVDDA